MRKGLSQGSWLQQGFLTLGVVVLAYAILLRGLAAPLPALPGSLEAALANPHYLCLTDGNGEGAPSHGPQACGECCLGLTRADAPPLVVAPVITPWPRLVWRPAAPSLTALRDGPPEEAWAKAHSQRGPPESRTPTSFT
jgi:hypothetical protein